MNMKEKVKYWLNVDFPTSTCTVHTIDCYFKPRKNKYKGVRVLARDGGWMPFPDVVSLRKYWLSLGNRSKIHKCKICNPMSRNQ